MEKTIQSNDLIRYCERLFIAAGVPTHRAHVLAVSLVDSDLRGFSSHGIIRIPVYMRRIFDELTECTAEVDKISEFSGAALLDGKNIIGQVVGREAMALAIEKAKKSGIACVGVRNTNHFGICGQYSEMATFHNMLGICVVNTTPLVAVHGGSKKAVGNNPLSIALPARKHFPILLDMACSVAQGKIEVLNKQGLDIPLGWAVDQDGNPTTNAADALKGVLLPVAGPKGSGLAIAIDVIAGILTGSGVGAEIKHLNDPLPQYLGAFFIAIDISKFVGEELYYERVDGYIDYLKGTAVRDEQIFMPGECEYRLREERKVTGIPVPAAVLDELDALAHTLGIGSFMSDESAGDGSNT